MRKFIKVNFCIILLFSVLSFIGCESQYLGANRNDKWKKDLNYLQAALPKKHVNLFFKTSEEKFNKDINTLKNSVDNLNDDEIVVGINKIMASVGDGHTAAYKQSSKIYPIEFYCFKDGIYVVNTVSEYKKALHSKLVKINGVDIEKVKEKIIPLFVAENEGAIKKSIPKYLSNPETLHGIKVSSDTEKSVFTFENYKGEFFDVNIKSVDRGKDIKFIEKELNDTSYPLYMQKSNLNYWYKYLDKEKTLYFKYNEGGQDGENEEETIEEFIDKMLKFMDNHPVDKFVIDMRDNGGGGDRYMSPIIDKLKSSKINNKNNLFVIVGRRTFSAAIVNSIQLRKETNATFLGEPTSGKPNHYGAAKSFVLPNFKIEVGYSLQFNESTKDDSSTFMPDKVIEVSIKDYLNKKDPVLDYILYTKPVPSK